MAKNHEQHACSTCSALSPRLFQSFTTGLWECGPCALEDESPFMSREIVTSIKQRITQIAASKKRAELARKNFGHETQEVSA